MYVVFNAMYVVFNAMYVVFNAVTVEVEKQKGEQPFS